MFAWWLLRCWTVAGHVGSASLAAGPVPVTEAADRLNGRAGVAAHAELAAQPHDAVLDPVRTDAERVTPGQIKQLDRAQHLTAVPDERFKQAVLGRGELDRHALHGDLVGAE